MKYKFFCNYIVIWYNGKTNTYFYKKYHGSLRHTNYLPGFQNSYGHEVVLAIDISELVEKLKPKVQFKKWIIRRLNRLIRFIDNF